MLERLLLLHSIIVMVRVQCIDIQRHVPRDTPTSRETSLGVNNRVSARSRLHKIRVLLLEKTEVALRFPIPGAIGREEQIHFLQGTLAGFGIECPDHGDSDNVGGSEDIVRLLIEGLEHDGAEQGKPAVTDGPTNDTPGVTLGTDLEGEDLGRVEPRDSQPGGTKGGSEKEDHGNGTGAVALGGSRTERLVLTCAGETASEEHGNALDDRAPV